MPYSEAQLAHEADRARFYDPLIIRQFRQQYDEALPVTSFENDPVAADTSRRSVRASVAGTIMASTVFGSMNYLLWSLDKNSKLDIAEPFPFGIPVDTRMLVSGAITIACVSKFHPKVPIR